MMLLNCGLAVTLHFSKQHLRAATLFADDEFVLEVAVAAGCQHIVTHNVRDFGGAERFGVSIVQPGQFLRQLEES